MKNVVGELGLHHLQKMSSDALILLMVVNTN